MPFDGSFTEMRLEERALRHALAFYTGPEKWERKEPGGRGPHGGLCVGLAIAAIAEKSHAFDKCGAVADILDVTDVMYWNDRVCPSFAALIAHLKRRIAFYTQKRLKHSYIVIIGPGRQVKG